MDSAANTDFKGVAHSVLNHSNHSEENYMDLALEDDTVQVAHDYDLKREASPTDAGETAKFQAAYPRSVKSEFSSIQEERETVKFEVTDPRSIHSVPSRIENGETVKFEVADPCAMKQVPSPIEEGETAKFRVGDPRNFKSKPSLIREGESVKFQDRSPRNFESEPSSIQQGGNAKVQVADDHNFGGKPSPIEEGDPESVKFQVTNPPYFKREPLDELEGDTKPDQLSYNISSLPEKMKNSGNIPPGVGVIAFDFTGLEPKKRKPRKLVNRSLEDKYQAIAAVEGGTMKREVARLFGVPANTLSTWLKHRDKIKYAVETNDFSEHRRKMRTSRHENVNAVLYAWYTEAARQGITVNGPMLQQKAKEFALALGEDEFTGSTGWLCRFKDRHNICFRGTGNSSSSAGTKNVDWFSTTSDDANNAGDTEPDEKNSSGVEQDGVEEDIGLPNCEESNTNEYEYELEKLFAKENTFKKIKKTPECTSEEKSQPKRGRYDVSEEEEDVVAEKGGACEQSENNSTSDTEIMRASETCAKEPTIVPKASDFLELCGRMRLFMYCHEDMTDGLKHLSNIEQLFAKVWSKK